MQVSTHGEHRNPTVAHYPMPDGMLNGSDRGAFALGPVGTENKFHIEQVLDGTSMDGDEDSDDSDGQVYASLPPGMGISKSGKKTKGRVKIKMEFIDNKLRRYTTFSKRKTGIMKKAYELSTLTGTQVMLLVASETGHVYTFATRKLQPMITSESGKALIQTCLNSPDQNPGGPGHQQAVEQRMNPTGFEETELTYAVSEDEGKPTEMKPSFSIANIPQNSPESTPSPHQASATSLQQQQQLSSSLAQPPMLAAYIQGAPPTTSTTAASASKPGNISMQLPAGGIAAILPPGTPITIPMQQQQVSQSVSNQQPVYRFPSNLMSLAGIGGNIGTMIQASTAGDGSQAAATTLTTPSALNLYQGTTMVTSGTTNPTMTPGIVMYQMPQGVMYATPTPSALADTPIFNFQQTDQQTAGGAQPIIAMIQQVPVSLAGQFNSPQMVQLMPSGDATVTDLSQPTAAKKSRK